MFLLGWDENIWGRVTAEGFCLSKGRERTHPLKDAVIVTLTPQTLPFSSKILRSNSHSLAASSCPHSRTITAVSPLTLGHHANLSFSFHPAYQSFPCFHCLLCSAPSPASQPAGRHNSCHLVIMPTLLCPVYCLHMTMDQTTPSPAPHGGYWVSLDTTNHITDWPCNKFGLSVSVGPSAFLSNPLICPSSALSPPRMILILVFRCSP